MNNKSNFWFPMLAALCLCAPVVHAQVPTPIHISMRDSTGTTKDRLVTFTPLDGWRGFNGTNIVSTDPIPVQTHGGVADTNLVIGNYLVSFEGLPNSFTIFWPGDTSITNLADPRIQRSGMVGVFVVNTNALPPNLVTNGQSGVSLPSAVLFNSTLKAIGGSAIFSAQRSSGQNALQIVGTGEVLGISTNNTTTIVLDPNRGDITGTRAVLSSVSLHDVGGIVSGTNSIVPTYDISLNEETVYASSISWCNHLSDTFVQTGYVEGGGEQEDDLVLWNNGTFGLSYDIGRLDGHVFSITDGNGDEIAWSPEYGFPFPSPLRMLTNSTYSDLYLSCATNYFLNSGFTVLGGPLTADLRRSTNLPAATGINWNVPQGSPRIPYDGFGITNGIPPANWGSALCPFPQFGWNSYLQQGCGGVNENSCIGVINWMTNQGVVAAGPEGSTWLWIDCGWSTNALSNTNSQFPNGITNVVNMAHANKIKVGIYVGVNGGPFGPAITVANAFNVVSNFATWQMDGIKLDGNFSDFAPARIEDHVYGSRIMANAILACKNLRNLSATRTNLLLLDFTLHDAMGSPWFFPPVGSTPPELFANAPMWETTSVQEVNDVQNGLRAADITRPILGYQQPGRFGQLLFGNEQGGNVSNSEATNTANMNLTFPGFIHIGVTNALMTSIYTNRELRAILHDPVVAPSREIYSNGWFRIWARPLNSQWGGDKYLMCFINGNRTGAATTNMSVSAAGLGWPSGASILAHDPYRQTDIGISNGTFTATVTTNQSQIWVLSRVATSFVIPNRLTAPTPAELGVNGGVQWRSNTVFYWSYSVDGSASNAAVKIAP